MRYRMTKGRVEPPSRMHRLASNLNDICSVTPTTNNRFSPFDEDKTSGFWNAFENLIWRHNLKTQSEKPVWSSAAIRLFRFVMQSTSGRTKRYGGCCGHRKCMPLLRAAETPQNRRTENLAEKFAGTFAEKFAEKLTENHLAASYLQANGPAFDIEHIN